jgi:DNA-binding transcriptional regulator YdaS (Cro superfamily)
METKTAITKSIEFFDGNTTKMANILGGTVVRQNIEYWRKTNRVPAEYCPQIEAATQGLVRCEELRPDVMWSVVRNTPNTLEAPIQQAQPATNAVAQGV